MGPLHLAARSGSEAILKQLLDAKVRVTRVTRVRVRIRGRIRIRVRIRIRGRIRIGFYFEAIFRRRGRP